MQPFPAEHELAGLLRAAPVDLEDVYCYAWQQEVCRPYQLFPKGGMNIQTVTPVICRDQGAYCCYTAKEDPEQVMTADSVIVKSGSGLFQMKRFEEAADFLRHRFARVDVLHRMSGGGMILFPDTGKAYFMF